MKRRNGTIALLTAAVSICACTGSAWYELQRRESLKHALAQTEASLRQYELRYKLSIHSSHHDGDGD